MSAATAAADVPHAEVKHRGLITLCVMGASIMQALDTTIANVALPHIQGSLSSTQEQMSWVLTSYIVATAIHDTAQRLARGPGGPPPHLPVFGHRLHGGIRVLRHLAVSLPEIVFARTLQGICGAALIPMSQAVMLDINPPERHGRAMSLWVMGVTVGRSSVRRWAAGSPSTTAGAGCSSSTCRWASCAGWASRHSCLRPSRASRALISSASPR